LRIDWILQRGKSWININELVPEGKAVLTNIDLVSRLEKFHEVII
jgi:hypothetical protein